MSEKDKFKVVSFPSGSTKGGSDSGNSGGTPPGDGGLEKRIEKLESTTHDVQLRLVRIETKLESMATKADIEGVNTRIEAMGRTMIQWAVGSAVVLAGLAFTAARVIAAG
jgi:hypothetical protein